MCVCRLLEDAGITPSCDRVYKVRIQTKIGFNKG